MKVTKLILAAVALSVSPQVFAQSGEGPDAFAQENCGDGRAQALGFSSYGACYDAAVEYYYNGGLPSAGGGGSSGGSGPYFYPTGDGCTARSRLCDEPQPNPE